MANGGYSASGGGSGQNGASSSQAQASLDNFWAKTLNEVKETKADDFKNQELPLARIKKIMKLDEDVKMISAEAPVLFAKAAEIFINELTLRAWLHTEDNKRRTLQRNDIAMAISKYDQFDFLIDIVPREELKPPKRPSDQHSNANAAMGTDQVQYYYQLAQQHQAALQQQGVATGGAASQIQILQPGGTAAGQTFVTPQGQIIQLAMPSSAGATTDGSQASQPQIQGNAIQLVSPLVTPSGEIVNQNIPIALGGQQIIRLPSGTTNAPIILQAPIQTSGGQFITQSVVSGTMTSAGQSSASTSQAMGRSRMSGAS